MAAPSQGSWISRIRAKRQSTQSQPMTELDHALHKTDFYDAINAMPNITCLTPDNAALSNAGNPQESLGTFPDFML